MKRIFIILLLSAGAIQTMPLKDKTINSVTDQAMPQSLQDKAINAVADSIVKGQKTIAQAKGTLPAEVYELVARQVILKSIAAAKTFDEAIQIIKQFSTAEINNDKGFAGTLIKDLSNRFPVNYNRVAIKAMHPEYSKLKIEQDAQKARFAPQSYITFAAAQLDTPGAVAWLKAWIEEHLNGNTAGIAIIDQHMENILNKIK